MQETMASKMPATTARPPRELPVMMVKPPSCWLVFWMKVVMSYWVKATAWCSLRLTAVWAACIATMFSTPVSGEAVLLVRRVSMALSPVDSMTNSYSQSRGLPLYTASLEQDSEASRVRVWPTVRLWRSRPLSGYGLFFTFFGIIQ
jgi:hypothetical protein